VRFEVLAAVVMRTSVLSNVAECWLVEIYDSEETALSVFMVACSSASSEIICTRIFFVTSQTILRNTERHLLPSGVQLVHLTLE
jgi:hypothetical protein